MTALDRDGESLLLAQFREFYYEVIRLKRLALTGRLTPDTSPKTGEDSGQAINVIWGRLLTLLEHQASLASRRGGEYIQESCKENQFIMAALADEIFLQLKWDGKDLWQSNLLETRLFQTHAAGDIFFQKLDVLLKQRNPIHVELAKVYLMALALGFQGKYRGTPEIARLDFYRRELFSFIFHKDPDPGMEHMRFCEQAYLHNVEEGGELKLPNPGKWVAIFVGLAIGLVVMSHGIWIKLTSDLDKATDRILVRN
jgi:type VI secretion system protein ImpK